MATRILTLYLAALLYFGSIGPLHSHIPDEKPTQDTSIIKLLKYCKSAGYPTQYDKLIRKAVRKHWPLDWQAHHCRYRAQLAKESSLNALHCNKANSAGAKCLAQLLPGTATQVEKATGLRGTRSNTSAAIYGGAWYMSWQGKGWLRTGRSAVCRIELALMGYISGRGHIYRAQKLAQQEGLLAMCYEEISTYLNQVVSSRSARDIREYITTIRQLSLLMEAR